MMCSKPGCSGSAISRGLCNSHYAKLRRSGDAFVRVEELKKKDREQLWMFVKKELGL